MSDATTDAYLAYAAQAAYVLLYEDAPYKESTRPLEDFGPFADVIKMLREFHQDAIALTLKTGKVYDVYADARCAWDGMRSSDDGTKQYGLLDRKMAEMAYAFARDEQAPRDTWVPPVASAPASVELTRTWLTEDELENIPDPIWLFGHELVANEINLVFGLSGVGKTFYAIDRALQVATQNEGAVMYVAAEDVRGVKLRKNAWRAFHKEPGGTFYVWPEEVNFMDPLAAAGFLLQVRDIPLTMIVIDTLAQCAVGSDTSSNTDMTVFMSTCLHICRETGAALLIVHHTDKNGLNYLGAQSIRAESYMMIQLADEEGIIKVICNKARNGVPFTSYRLRIVSTGDSAVVLPTGQVSDRDAPLSEHQVKALEVLAYSIFGTTGATLGELKSSTGIPEGSIYRVLNSLKAAGHLSQGTKGHPYFITDRGRDALVNYQSKGAHQEGQQSQLSRTINHPSQPPSLSPEEPSSPSHTLGVMVDGSASESREVGNNGVPKDYQPTAKSQEMIERLKGRKTQL